MDPKEIFNSLVNEFGLKANPIMHDTWINVKYKNYGGFLMQLRCDDNNNYICFIAKGIDCKKGILWGADSYYDYEKAKDKINEFILLDKQYNIENMINAVNDDFN